MSLVVFFGSLSSLAIAPLRSCAKVFDKKERVIKEMVSNSNFFIV